jgi:hypothetical protein
MSNTQNHEGQPFYVREHTASEIAAYRAQISRNLAWALVPDQVAMNESELRAWSIGAQHALGAYDVSSGFKIKKTPTSDGYHPDIQP